VANFTPLLVYPRERTNAEMRQSLKLLLFIFKNLQKSNIKNLFTVTIRNYKETATSKATGA